MRAVIQRVTHASVSASGSRVGSIGLGLVVLVGIEREDTREDAEYLVEKAVNLRVFPDAQDRFNRSALDVGAELLVVSQFTLCADTRKGRRPSFVQAAPPEEAAGLFKETVELFRRQRLTVETGRFQEHMEVELVNDGPVTILLDSRDRLRPRRG
ncbi:MAG: D-tyrosyl-tRNA(Tyr) deacylase [Chloroflexi bacterium]|nr:D-tyrosyl-tRNA(Tyr) deacylase [Chloroflexota bacterium]